MVEYAVIDCHRGRILGELCRLVAVEAKSRR